MADRPLPVVLDVDTGVDDALALLLAARHPGLDLRAVSCVAGNVGVDQVVANTLRVLDAAGAGDVPVARGADRPLVEPAREARHVHGEDGLGDLGLPRSHRRAEGVHAVELLRRAVLDAPEPVTLVALAPLTNVALLLRSHPEVGPRLARVVVMGGAATGGNATAAAEFNVWHDPEAAEVVLGAGLPVTLYGLDVFYEVALTAAEADALAASGEPAAALAGRLVRHQVARLGGVSGTLGDAGAVAAALDPGGLRTERLPVRVELAGRWTRGQTVVDRRAPHDRAADPLGPPGPPVDVALQVDADRYRRLFLDAVTGVPSWAA
ncbi:nucleoside hydrolase [Vallicoccus soli]|uniref:Nucleoside hydrolase n=1 Tax=Vallicoccus soli TaxID=2339232 RepID=A0A3A3ZCF6_9ACTN|nr:nucleoside hydrolase [Vallicoccus soli]RJK92614.1 nucleoside hydrolase [Vallicoccus soli]